MIRHGEPPFLECSSKGDVRFSAFYARIHSRGNKTIEEIYQASKIFADGTTGLPWRQAKGKACINQDEVRALYDDLWREYIKENRHTLVDVLVQSSGLSDVFGQSGHACQASSLWKIREEAIQEYHMLKSRGFDMSDNKSPYPDGDTSRQVAASTENPYSKSSEATKSSRFSFGIRPR